MITIRGFTITHKNAAFLGLGIALGYVKALADSEDILNKLEELANVIIEGFEQADAVAEESKAKEEAVDSTAVEIRPEIEKETPKEVPVQ